MIGRGIAASDRPKNILIVDDSETFLTYLSVTLHRMGHNKIMPTNNGMDALKLIKLLMPDVVLLDIAMPQIDGITTLRLIKDDEQMSSIPVIMLTTASDTKTYEKCKKLGCFGYLTKPVKVSDLNETINKCITYEGGKKRKFLRTMFEKKVTVTHNGVTEEHYAVNLSEGGMYIRKINPFPVGTKVEIALPLKENKPIKLKGIVIYVRYISRDLFKIAPGMAIEFEELSSEDSAMLKAYIIKLLTADIIEEQKEPVIIKED